VLILGPGLLSFIGYIICLVAEKADERRRNLSEFLCYMLLGLKNRRKDKNDLNTLQLQHLNHLQSLQLTVNPLSLPVQVTVFFFFRKIAFS
jgi:hypothetical protein